ncbi:hypothetical protein CC86DRAFT_19685 [Ophiobolus disseminans]|uniref:Uncharacterized protein n=1 Tax=Ophiobolus disseminans TaxID=1469910 RepID=A0A6A7A2B6_9PLEO|nr:hypothetical protein CC86DRAFT_19685 [Ophiobolus disseminans]
MTTRNLRREDIASHVQYCLACLVSIKKQQTRTINRLQLHSRQSSSRDNCTPCFACKTIILSCNSCRHHAQTLRLRLGSVHAYQTFARTPHRNTNPISSTAANTLPWIKPALVPPPPSHHYHTPLLSQTTTTNLKCSVPPPPSPPTGATATFSLPHGPTINPTFPTPPLSPWTHLTTSPRTTPSSPKPRPRTCPRAS